MPFCSNCGAQLLPPYKFCTNCGFNLEQAQFTSPSTYSPQPTFQAIKKVCPMCGAPENEIRTVEDRSKIISYIPKPIYSMKKVCTKCGYEF